MSNCSYRIRTRIQSLLLLLDAPSIHVVLETFEDKPWSKATKDSRGHSADCIHCYDIKGDTLFSSCLLDGLQSLFDFSVVAFSVSKHTILWSEGFIVLDIIEETDSNLEWRRRLVNSSR